MPQESTACMVKELAMPAVSADAVPGYPTTLHLLAHTRPVLISTGMDATISVANHELCCGTAYTPLLMILSVTPLPVEVPVHTYCSNTSYMSRHRKAQGCRSVCSCCRGSRQHINYHLICNHKRESIRCAHVFYFKSVHSSTGQRHRTQSHGYTGTDSCGRYRQP